MIHVVTPPVGDGPWPGVVVLHEAFGLNDDIREHAGRLAAAGYLAVAPDLYRGQGMRRCLVATFKALSAEHGRPFEDIEAVRRELAARPDCTGKVGVIGFCMGGKFALLMPDRDADYAVRVIEKMQKLLEEVEVRDHPELPRLTFSAGIAEYNIPAEPFDHTLLAADHVLDARMIRQLQDFEKKSGSRLPIFVQRARASAA